MSVYDMHHIGYGIFQIGGTKAFHIRAYQCCPRLVGNGNYECQTDHAEQSHFQWKLRSITYQMAAYIGTQTHLPL